ncbi:MAG: response regulator [Acidobacteriota bacterium]|nr:response regulator [Acidobacteriota bacterium]
MQGLSREREGGGLARDFAKDGNRVLVVEDDPGTRRGVQEILEGEGFAVDGAEDGAQALQFLRRSSPPAFILLDLAMPGMTGWEFRREQLADPDLRRIPVVVMTNYEEYDEALTALHPDGHLQKPIRPDELRGVVARFR